MKLTSLAKMTGENDVNRNDFPPIQASGLINLNVLTGNTGGRNSI